MYGMTIQNRTDIRLHIRPPQIANLRWGAAGATRAVDILSRQIATNLAQRGIAAIDQLGPHYLTEIVPV